MLFILIGLMIFAYYSGTIPWCFSMPIIPKIIMLAQYVKAYHWHCSRGSHIHVACRSVCDWDQESWLVKIVLDHSIPRLLIAWFYRSSKDKTLPHSYQRKCFDQLILVAQNSSWSLIGSWTECWSLDSILIPVTNTSTGNVYVTTPCCWNICIAMLSLPLATGSTPSFLHDHRDHGYKIN